MTSFLLAATHQLEAPRPAAGHHYCHPSCASSCCSTGSHYVLPLTVFSTTVIDRLDIITFQGKLRTLLPRLRSRLPTARLSRSCLAEDSPRINDTTRYYDLNDVPEHTSHLQYTLSTPYHTIPARVTATLLHHVGRPGSKPVEQVPGHVC